MQNGDVMAETADQDSQILLVEDDIDDANLIKRIIYRAPISVDVHICSNGQEALDHLSECEAAAKGKLPDLILLDMNMPVMNGTEFLKALRSHSTLKGLPICVFTTSQDEAVIKAAYEDGANVVVSKVASLEGMRKVVETIVNFWFSTAKHYYVE